MNTFQFKTMAVLAVLVLSMVIVPSVIAQTDDADEGILVQGYTSDVLPFDPSEGSQTDSANFNGSEGLILGGTPTVLDISSETDPLSFAFALINTALSFLGLLFLIVLLYAGIIWVQARGNAEEIERAKKNIQRGLVGLIIILAALSISNTIFDIINNEFTSPESAGGSEETT